jgi:hypothetical protein
MLVDRWQTVRKLDHLFHVISTRRMSACYKDILAVLLQRESDDSHVDCHYNNEELCLDQHLQSLKRFHDLVRWTPIKVVNKKDEPSIAAREDCLITPAPKRIR